MLLKHYMNKQEPAIISSLTSNPTAADEVWSERRRNALFVKPRNEVCQALCLIWAEVGRYRASLVAQQ